MFFFRKKIGGELIFIRPLRRVSYPQDTAFIEMSDCFVLAIVFNSTLTF